jgi:hypothetical protein
MGNGEWEMGNGELVIGNGHQAKKLKFQIAGWLSINN